MDFHTTQIRMKDGELHHWPQIQPLTESMNMLMKAGGRCKANLTVFDDDGYLQASTSRRSSKRTEGVDLICETDLEHALPALQELLPLHPCTFGHYD